MPWCIFGFGQHHISTPKTLTDDIDLCIYIIQNTHTQKKITVHPVINVRNQLVGSPFEKDVTIECNVEASPKSINYWIKDTGKRTLYIYKTL